MMEYGGILKEVKNDLASSARDFGRITLVALSLAAAQSSDIIYSFVRKPSAYHSNADILGVNPIFRQTQISHIVLVMSPILIHYV